MPRRQVHKDRGAAVAKLERERVYCPRAWNPGRTPLKVRCAPLESAFSDRARREARVGFFNSRVGGQRLPRLFAPYSNTPRTAVRVVPLYEAEIWAEVEIRTSDVVTVKLALVAPAGTVTLPGTCAAPGLLLESATTTPPAGAGPLSVTVPVEACMPPMTLDGLSVSEVRVTGGGGAGVTVSEAVRVTPL